MRLLVVGLGSIGQRHLANLLALGVDAAGLDPNPTARAQATARFGVPVFAEEEAAYALRPDAAVIATPTTQHVAAAWRAIAAGCHLLIEKPLADRLDGLDDLEAAVRQRGLVALVACNMRFLPALRRAKELLDAGVLGRVLAARAMVGQYLPDYHPGCDYRLTYRARRATGGGIVLDAIHELDYLRWLLGEPVLLGAAGGHLSTLETDAEDVAAALLRFPGGALGEVHLDCVQRAYARDCQIIGEDGTLAWDVHRGGLWHYDARVGTWRHYPDPPGSPFAACYLAEIEHFLRCVRGEDRPEQDLAAARRVLALALQIRAACQGGV